MIVTRTKSRVPARRAGITLVEILVCLSIIVVLVAMILPAVQAAREAARRGSCANNLRQIGVGVLNYHDVNGSLPVGEMLVADRRYIDAQMPCRPWIKDAGFLVEILPYIEQSILYNAVNHSLTVHGLENRTIGSVSIAIYACPSDPASGMLRAGHPFGRLAEDFALPGGTDAELIATSYAGCHSDGALLALPEPSLQCRVSPVRAASANGCITDVGPVTLASITDGTSQTIMAAEKSITALLPLQSRTDRLGQNLFNESGWWYSGAMGDSLVTGLYAPNAFKRAKMSNTHAWTWSASSLHPDGVNVIMADGSVRFVKDTIDSRSVDSVEAPPPLGKGRRGVWQHLASRNGGEVLTGDDY